MYVCVFITTSIPQLNKHMIILSNNYIYIPYMYTYIESTYTLYTYTLYTHDLQLKKRLTYLHRHFPLLLSPHIHKHTHPPFR